MKKLRFFVLVITVVMCLSAFAACNGNDKTDIVPVKPEQPTVTALPTLTFDGETPENNTLVIAVTNKAQIVLPQYVAKNRFGKEMDNSAVAVTHMYDGAVDNSVTYKAGASSRKYYAVGQHTFIFVVTDNDNATLVNYYYVYLTVYQSLFKVLGNRDVLQGELSEAPTLRTNDPGFALSWFNLDRSDVYYAEATFDSVDKEENDGRDWGIGLLHATDEDGSYSLKDYYRIYDWGNTWAHRYSRGWNPDSSFVREFYTSQGLVDPGFNVGGNKITIGIARVGDVFYSFLNGQLTDKYVYAALKDRKTSPGICLIGNDVVAYPGTASNMKFVSGDEAEMLIAKLCGEDTYYNDFGYGRVLEGYNAATFTDGGFAFDKIGDFGASQRNWWNCAVKANTYIGGNSTVEFDLETVGQQTSFGTLRIYIKKAMNSADPTNGEGFYNGIRLCYFGNSNRPGGVNVETLQEIPDGDGTRWEHMDEKDADGNARYENFDAANVFSENAKLHVKIHIEPLAGENGETKFTYTFTEIGKENPNTYTFFSYATQESSSAESEDEYNELFFMSFMTENVQCKISNLLVTANKVY